MSKSPVLDTRNSGLERLSVKSIHDARWIQTERTLKGAEGTLSVREFGGLWGVDGLFLLTAATLHGATFASMIDVTPTPGFKTKIDEARKKIPALEVEFVNSDFRNPSLFEALFPVDTSLLFNVLLHQENYISVVGGVCKQTRKYVCVTQPCFRETYFKVPSSATLLQFWPDEVKDRFREQAYWPAQEDKVESFSTQSWMWGHSTSHLIDVFKGFGWTLQDGVILDGFLGEHWECPCLRFVPGEHAALHRRGYSRSASD